MDETRLLVVEDEPVTRMMLDARLRAAGFSVTAVDSAELALDLLRSERFAVLVTDLLLQRLDGISLMVEARTIDPELEVIVLTGAASIDSAIAAVNQGAHTYLRKPPRHGELEARIAAARDRRRARVERTLALRQLSSQLLRIAEPEAPAYQCDGDGEARIRIGALEIDTLRRRVSVDQRAVTLSSGEFDLLLYMARRDQQVLSAEELAREVLRCPACSTAEARELIKARIHRLRQKIEPDPHAPRLIVSVRGAGYMLTGGG